MDFVVKKNLRMRVWLKPFVGICGNEGFCIAICDLLGVPRLTALGVHARFFVVAGLSMCYFEGQCSNHAIHGTEQ